MGDREPNPGSSKSGSKDGTRDTTAAPDNFDIKGKSMPSANANPFTNKVEPPPSVPGGSDTPGKGVTKVSTAAMKTFITNVNALQDPLKKSQADLKALEGQLAPGTFPSAVALRKSVDGGDGGLIDQTITSLESIIQAVAGLNDAFGKMVKVYASTEELNNVKSKDFGRLMEETSGAINSLGNGGKSA